jgi:hypothetical protein
VVHLCQEDVVDGTERPPAGLSPNSPQAPPPSGDRRGGAGELGESTGRKIPTPQSQWGAALHTRRSRAR